VLARGWYVRQTQLTSRAPEPQPTPRAGRERASSASARAATDLSDLAALGGLIGNRALGRVLGRRRWLLRRTDTPDEVTVHQDTKTNAVVRVTTGTGDASRDLTFHVLGTGQDLPATIAEGSAVVTVSGKKVSAVRFANDSVAGTEWAGLAKVKKFATVAYTAPPAATAAPSRATRSLDHQVSKTGGIVHESFQGFEGQEAGDQHFAKHGHEFNAKDKPDYIRQAKAFGEQPGTGFCEARIANTLIRVDPPGKTRRVFVAAGKKIRTYYKWSWEFASDPFAFAIYYTITHNMGISLADLDPDVLDDFDAKGVDLRSMDAEVVLRTLPAVAPEPPRELVEAVRARETEISEALAAMATGV
jgi:hypothetical protein